MDINLHFSLPVTAVLQEPPSQRKIKWIDLQVLFAFEHAATRERERDMFELYDLHKPSSTKTINPRRAVEGLNMDATLHRSSTVTLAITRTHKCTKW